MPKTTQPSGVLEGALSESADHRVRPAVALEHVPPEAVLLRWIVDPEKRQHRGREVLVLRQEVVLAEREPGHVHDERHVGLLGGEALPCPKNPCS